ncbi:MAG: hypothetical protein COY58_00710 [Gammaproteobacteria bacterium CG_4_10_14_0_8_um_filter_38_16]|nr:MAG: hypothetical protein COY58_00710 [Gammaproteobacteria bacterium CG_4_10_14_0_8_um_filter_38_16]PJA04320.1 MAG: hypothetical protein COX72_00640 [Gammaproteobacteria bacterium CG_4_10_14_0_2_um_filter_38_22]PJB10074.1 MAG: hypothetical protein CO120_06650 [Gammaproteobacteria bacterium CG_4_9_14_3_um_filter_38_9]
MTNTLKSKWVIGMITTSCLTLASLTAIASEAVQNQIAENCKPYLMQDTLPNNLSAKANASLKACYQNNSCQNGALSDVSNCARKLLNWESSYDLPKINVPLSSTIDPTQKPTDDAQPAAQTPTAASTLKKSPSIESPPAPADLSGNNGNTEEKQPQQKKTETPAINWF